jgi:hypothetical protein
MDVNWGLRRSGVVAWTTRSLGKSSGAGFGSPRSRVDHHHNLRGEPDGSERSPRCRSCSAREAAKNKSWRSITSVRPLLGPPRLRPRTTLRRSARLACALEDDGSEWEADAQARLMQADLAGGPYATRALDRPTLAQATALRARRGRPKAFGRVVCPWASIGGAQCSDPAYTRANLGRFGRHGNPRGSNIS